MRLEVPSANRYLHIIRLTTAGAAAEAGLNTEEIEDIKIAVDELCSLTMDITGDDDVLDLRFSADGTGLTIETTVPHCDAGLEVDELARAILDATVDQLDLEDPSLGCGFRLTKQRTGG